VKKTKRQKLDDNVNTFMLKCTEALDTNNALSEYDAMGISFAAKMKKIKTDQQIYAELLCQKVCAKGLLQQLNADVDVVDMKNLNKSHQLYSFNYDNIDTTTLNSTTPKHLTTTDESSHSYINYGQLNNLQSDSSSSTESSVTDYFTNFLGERKYT